MTEQDNIVPFKPPHERRIDDAVAEHVIEGIVQCERIIENPPTPNALRDARRQEILLESMAMGRLSPARIKKLHEEVYNRLHPEGDDAA